MSLEKLTTEVLFLRERVVTLESLAKKYSTLQTDQKYYSPSEAARILGVSIFTVKKLTDVGVLESFRSTGGHRRIKAESLSKYLESEVQKIVS